MPEKRQRLLKLINYYLEHFRSTNKSQLQTEPGTAQNWIKRLEDGDIQEPKSNTKKILKVISENLEIPISSLERFLASECEEEDLEEERVSRLVINSNLPDIWNPEKVIRLKDRKHIIIVELENLLNNFMFPNAVAIVERDVLPTTMDLVVVGDPRKAPMEPKLKLWHEDFSGDQWLCDIADHTAEKVDAGEYILLGRVIGVLENRKNIPNKMTSGLKPANKKKHVSKEKKKTCRSGGTGRRASFRSYSRAVT